MTTPGQSRQAEAGVWIRKWRCSRGLSQLELALDAGVSTRHLSYVETGRSQPSRALLARLLEALRMPLRERNAVFLAAGYSPPYPETPRSTEVLSQVDRAAKLILDHQEPFPAFLLNRRWDILASNRAAERVAQHLIGGSRHSNMLRQFLDPDDLRGVVDNWGDVALTMLSHLHDSIAAAPSDMALRELLEEVSRYAGVPERWTLPQANVPQTPLLTVHFRTEGRELRFFSTVTLFAVPRDLTVEDLRIECSFPADQTTEDFCASLASRDAT